MDLLDTAVEIQCSTTELPRIVPRQKSRNAWKTSPFSLVGDVIDDTFLKTRFYSQSGDEQLQIVIRGRPAGLKFLAPPLPGQDLPSGFADHTIHDPGWLPMCPWSFILRMIPRNAQSSALETSHVGASHFNTKYREHHKSNASHAIFGNEDLPNKLRVDR